MSISLVDTHCHINFFKNAGDIALDCERKRVHTIYVTTLPSQFNETFEYVKSLKYIYPSLGFHCLESDYDLKKEKEIFLRNVNKTKFIGEVGLDFSRRAIKSKEEQIELLNFVLESIKGKDKVLNLHSTRAEDDVLELILKFGIKKAIFHWYSGKIGILNRIIENGYFFSVNEAMCKSKKGQNIIAKLPKNRVLVETDAPFIKTVLPYSNFVVYEYLQNLWDEEMEMVQKRIKLNFKTLCNTGINENLFH